MCCDEHWLTRLQVKADRSETGKDTQQQIKELQQESKKVNSGH